MKTFLVTGGARGIGRAIVVALRAEGSTVIVCDVAPMPEWESTESYRQCDLSSPTELAQMEDWFSSLSLDGLVHCAGVAHWSTLGETPRAQWERVLHINLHATIALTQMLAPILPSGGRIVLFGSGTVFKGPAQAFAYAASKAGVIAFARCLADELGSRQITVNVINPGMTRTPMVNILSETEPANIASRAIKRPAEPEDLVGPVLFLLSSASNFVTGQSLMVDGGSVKR